MVVLFPDPALGAEVGGGDEFFQCFTERERSRHGGGFDYRELLRFRERAIVFRRLIAKLLDRQVRHFIAVVADEKTKRVGGVADDREVEAPLLEDGFRLGLLAGLQHHQHALLTLRQHHLVGRHGVFAHRHLLEIERDAEIALRTHFDRGAGEACGTHVLNGDDAAFGHDFETGLQQELFGERIAYLHGRTLLFGAFAEFGGRHGRAVDAVAPRLRAEVDDRQSNAGRFRVENLVGFRDADRHRVHENIAVVARMESDRTADGGNTKRVAVAADARDDTGYEMARLRVIG